jgi:hypothetical protein
MNLSVSRVGFAMPMQSQNVQFKGAEKAAKVFTDVVKEVVEKPDMAKKVAAVAAVTAGTVLAMINGKAPVKALDKTNYEACLQARPEQLFKPAKADNIKGQGITFLPVVPETADELAKVTYDVVPLPKANTVAELIAKAKEQGVNIELVQDSNGEYFMGVKDVWSNNYHRIDRDGAVIKYGYQDVSWTSVDADWAAANAVDGKVMDCAVIANAPGVRILEKSYVHEGGAPITTADMAKGQFRAHKDPNAKINAVAWGGERTVQTLEGAITTDATMGDVEGYAYNNFAQLVKQVKKDKIKADPADPNSAKFCELVKADKLDEAKSLLISATKI